MDQDPAAMTPEERRAEVAQLFAVAYLRKALAANATHEAQCDHVVSSRENGQVA